jgi:hypothetical protein
MNKERREILLKEYEVGQGFANSSQNRIWQITSILLILALGSPFGAFFLSNATKECDNRRLPLIITIGIFAIVLDLFWVLSWKREAFYLDVTYHRMREIETDLHMRRNLDIQVVDDTKTKNNLPIAEKQRLSHLSVPFWGIRTKHGVYIIAFFIFVFWIFVIINYQFEWIKYL